MVSINFLLLTSSLVCLFCSQTDGALTGYSPQRLFEEDERVYNVTIDKHPYQVTLTFEIDVPLGAFTKMPATETEFRTTEKITQCLNTIFKHAMDCGLISIGKSPNTFFLPEDDQRRLLQGNNRVFGQYYVSLFGGIVHIRTTQNSPSLIVFPLFSLFVSAESSHALCAIYRYFSVGPIL